LGASAGKAAGRKSGRGPDGKRGAPAEGSGPGGGAAGQAAGAGGPDARSGHDGRRGRRGRTNSGKPALARNRYISEKNEEDKIPAKMDSLRRKNL